jgi:hypothetical protein
MNMFKLIMEQPIINYKRTGFSYKLTIVSLYERLKLIYLFV